jgi:hypothetical protein
MIDMNRGTNGQIKYVLAASLLVLISVSGFTVTKATRPTYPPSARAMLQDYTMQCAYKRTDDEMLAQGQERVIRLPAVNSQDRWEILLPNVKNDITEYKQIAVRKGDEITINACGCVQTGGKGKTWKRYLLPLGENSDKFYHGLISFSHGMSMIPPPGIAHPQYPTTSPTVRTFQGHPASLFRIDEFIAAQGNGFRFEILMDGYLVLGYEDNDYHDNGYGGHDDGNPEQCAGIGGVSVLISVKHK